MSKVVMLPIVQRGGSIRDYQWTNNAQEDGCVYLDIDKIEYMQVNYTQDTLVIHLTSGEEMHFAEDRETIDTIIAMCKYDVDLYNEDQVKFA